LHNYSSSKVQKDNPHTSIEGLAASSHYSNQIRLLAYTALTKVLKFIKEATWCQQFPLLFEYVWCLVRHAQLKIEMMGSEATSSDKLIRKTTEKRDECYEQLIQVGLDLLQFVCVYVQKDSISDQEEQFNLLIHGILQFFNKRNNWESFQFA
jgi:hypothetical protein